MTKRLAGYLQCDRTLKWTALNILWSMYV